MATIEKTYIYKLRKAGVFAGTIPYATADFTYSQDINTGGAQIVIEVGFTPESAGIIVDVDYLVDDHGNKIIDHNSNKIITRKDYLFETIPVDLGNEIEVWQYDDNVPNGRRVFDGIITEWEADEASASMRITAYSYGVQLDNYLISISPNTKIINELDYDTTDVVYAETFKMGPYNRVTRAAETFEVTSPTEISTVSFMLGIPSGQSASTVTAELFSGTPTGATTFLASTSRVVDANALSEIVFSWTTPVALTTGVTYGVRLYRSGGVDTAFLIGRDTGGSLATSQAYTYNDSTAVYTVASGDFAFSVTTSSGALGNQFNSYDPSDMLISVIDNFNDYGGIVTYDDNSIDTTGTVASYTFKVKTVLDGINKILQLAPSRWFWYVDVGTNIIHFHPKNPEINHMFTRGNHVQNLRIKYSLTDIKNYGKFSGGEVAGVNVTSTETNTASIMKYGQWLSKESDNRVTDQETADLLIGNIIAENSMPRFSTEMTLVEGKYDIESINLGDTVAFNNFNDLINDLRLQVVSIRRSPSAITIGLDTVPPSQTHRIEDIRRNLDAQQTVNNPDD